MPPRWISYHQAERLCGILAGELRQQLGGDLTRCDFVAIPRGGLIVLGMLSYLLGLDREQLVAPGAGRSPLVVVVDDCSLSGARFGAMLAHLDAERRGIERPVAEHIVFAHLLSPLSLREALLGQEPRVVACVAAEALPELPSEPAEASRLALEGKRYWLGRTPPVAFAWSEPDQVVWNPHSKQVEHDWHRVSPGCCLDARVDLGLPLDAEAGGPFDVPADVLWRVAGEDVWLWHSGQDEVYGLHGVSGAMWRALVGYGETAAAARFLLSGYHVAEERLRADLEDFVQRLTAQGLLCRRPAMERDES